MKIARAKSKPSRAGGKENQNSIFAHSVAILHNSMDLNFTIIGKTSVYSYYSIIILFYWKIYKNICLFKQKNIFFNYFIIN